MGEVIQFPKNRIVRRPEQIIPKLAEKQEKDVQITQFIEENWGKIEGKWGKIEGIEQELSKSFDKKIIGKKKD